MSCMPSQKILLSKNVKWAFSRPWPLRQLWQSQQGIESSCHHASAGFFLSSRRLCLPWQKRKKFLEKSQKKKLLCNYISKGVIAGMAPKDVCNTQDGIHWNFECTNFCMSLNNLLKAVEKIVLTQTVQKLLLPMTSSALPNPSTNLFGANQMSRSFFERKYTIKSHTG